MDKDVTDKVEFGNSDDEFLPLEKCVCGQVFGFWDHSLSIYRDNPTECPKCGRKLYFKNKITVFEVNNAKTR